MKYLVVSEKDGVRVHRFPLNCITYAKIDGKLYVSKRGVQFAFRLDRYDYKIAE